MLGIIFLLAGNKIADWIFLKEADEGLKLLSLSKDLVLLVTVAFVTYFFIQFYQQHKQVTAINYQTLFNGNPNAIYVMEKQTLKILAVNEAMCKLYGYTEKEFLSMSALDIRPAEEHSRIKEFLEHFGELTNESGKWIHKKKNGERFHVQITFHSLSLLKKDTYLVMVTDISKSINDEKKINDLLHLYETVNKATNDVIWDYDLAADKLSWMQGYKETYGHEHDSGPNTFWEMNNVHAEDRQHTIDFFTNVVVNREKSWFAEYRYVCVDGTVKYIADRGYLIFNAEGEPSRMIGAMQDISNQKRYAQQLLNQNDQLREIAWINSHEVRRPLSNILGLVSLIKNSSDDREEMLQLIDLLDISAKELDEAVVMINRQTMEGEAKSL
jgi:PAS domain S-box-containing protein